MEPLRLTTHPPARHQGAFSILELLAVMVIMAIVFTLGGLITTGPIESMKLTEAAQTLSNELARARQSAMTSNREVEFRIYQSDPHNEGTDAFRSFAYGVIDAVTDPADPDYQDPTSPDFSPPFTPSAGRTNLHSGHLFIESAPYSTLITGHDNAVLNVRTGTETRDDGTSAPFVAFTFLPEGRAALDSDKMWTLTLIREADSRREGSELATNFVSIQIRPESGRATTYRP